MAVKSAAGWKCGICGMQCRRPGEPLDTHKRTLTVAHLDHDEGSPDPRLMAMCSGCHNRYDAPERARRRREKKKCRSPKAEA
jgi:hypothetical protein